MTTPAAQERIVEYDTELVCLMCNRLMLTVRHSDLLVTFVGEQLVTLPGAKDLSTCVDVLAQRCTSCGGAPLRGETSEVLSFRHPDWVSDEKPHKGRPTKYEQAERQRRRAEAARAEAQFLTELDARNA